MSVRLFPIKTEGEEEMGDIVCSMFCWCQLLGLVLTTKLSLVLLLLLQCKKKVIVQPKVHRATCGSVERCQWLNLNGLLFTDSGICWSRSCVDLYSMFR